MSDRDVETVDLDAVESRRQVMFATADVGEALGGNAAIRDQLVLEMGKAAARSANDVPALVTEVRRLRAALASQPAQSGVTLAAAKAGYARFTEREYARGGHRLDDMTAALLAALPHLKPAQSGDGVAEAVARERERIGAALERLAELRKDYLPGLTGGQMPHIDLIAHEINTVKWVLRILRGGDARGWAHSFRWDDLDGLDALARTTTEEDDHG